MKITEVFKNERGGVDLASIMTGGIVVGIAGGVIAATTLGVIPFVQDKTAQSSLNTISVAQSAYKHGNGEYGNLKALVENRLLEESYMVGGNEDVSRNGKLCTSVDDVTGEFQASSKSGSGKYYRITSTSPKPTEVTEAQSCFTDDYAAWNMVMTIDTSIPDCTTFVLPVATPNGLTVRWGDGKEDAVTSDYPTHTYVESEEHTIRLAGKFSRFGRDVSTTIPIPPLGTNHCITSVKKWQNTNTTSLSSAFDKATNLTEMVEFPTTVNNLNYAFRGATAFNGDTTKWNTSNVLYMGVMFQDATSFNQPVEHWNVAKVQNFSSMFQRASSFNQPLNNWNTISANNMSAMFDAATAFDQPLSNFKTAKVTNMSYMFRNVPQFNQSIGNWDTGLVTSMYAMFNRASTFNQNIGGWNTAKVNNLGYMFSEAPVFNQDISNWITTSNTKLNYTFYKATAFNQPIGKWNTSLVDTMDAMMYGTTNFNYPVNTWDVSKVTNMRYLFFGNAKFDQSLSAWDTSSVINMERMFYGASSFNQSMAHFKTAEVTKMDEMFRNTTKFNQNIKGWNVGKVATSVNFRAGSALTAANSPF